MLQTQQLMSAFHQQHVVPSAHSASYPTQMLTNLFSTVMDDYWISLFLLQKSVTVSELHFIYASGRGVRSHKSQI